MSLASSIVMVSRFDPIIQKLLLIWSSWSSSTTFSIGTNNTFDSNNRWFCVYFHTFDVTWASDYFINRHIKRSFYIYGRFAVKAKFLSFDQFLTFIQHTFLIVIYLSVELRWFRLFMNICLTCYVHLIVLILQLNITLIEVHIIWIPFPFSTLWPIQRHFSMFYHLIINLRNVFFQWIPLNIR